MATNRVGGNTTRTREVAHAASERFEIDPCNIDDAVYILGHPTEFTAEQRAIAEQTWRESDCY